MFSPLRNQKGVRPFLGITRYYRKFIKNYAKIAHHLTELIKKTTFQWNQIAQESFEQLKAAINFIPNIILT